MTSPNQTKRIQRLRKALWVSQQGRCFYCRTSVPLSRATLDHRVPKSIGGEVSFANGVMACEPCNAAKADAVAVRVTNKKVRKSHQPTPSALANQERKAMERRRVGR